MASNSALNDVLAQAEAAASNFQAPAVVAQTPGAVVQQAQGGALARPTMNDVLTGGGISVDEYLQNKSEGFRIGKEMKGLVEEITVEIDLSDVCVIYSSRHELNGTTKFLKSYDGVRTSEGKNFNAEVAHLDATGWKPSGVYQTVEIPAELLEDVKDPKSSLVIHEGTSVGITPSLTGFKEFQKFMKKLSKTHPELIEDVVQVKVFHIKRTNSKNNEWGVCGFELIEG